MTLAGIDVSAYQTTTPSLAGLSFAFAKASEGLFADPKYAMHQANFAKAGIVTGAYHFNRSDVGDPAKQATFFLGIAGNVDLYALDVEGTHAFSLAESQAFIATIHKAGKRVGMYHSRSGFPAAGQDWNWVADYGGQVPSIPWDIWQYGPRKIGTVSIDGDTFAGDAAALQKLIGGSTGGINQPGGDMAIGAVSNHDPKLVDIPGNETQFLEDGKTPDTVKTAGGTAVPSPCAIGTLRGYWISQSAGVYGLRFAAPTKVYDAPVDCTAAVKAATDPLTAKIAAAKVALG